MEAARRANRPDPGVCSPGMRGGGRAPWPPLVLTGGGALRARGVVEVGQRHPRQPLPDRLLDAAEIRSSSSRHQRERRPGQFGAGGAADAVDIVVGDVRHIEVDDVAERGDIDASRCDVGGDEDAVSAVLEPGERFGALRLRAVAVNALDGDAAIREVAWPDGSRDASCA